jgi:hypothetical protein
MTIPAFNFAKRNKVPVDIYKIDMCEVFLSLVIITLKNFPGLEGYLVITFEVSDA